MNVKLVQWLKVDQGFFKQKKIKIPKGLTECIFTLGVYKQEYFWIVYSSEYF